MRPFMYNSQTAMFFGRGCIGKNGHLFKKYGKRAAVFTTAFPQGHVNLGLEDIKGVFAENGIDFIVIDRVQTDPPVEVVDELAAQLREYEAEFFIAVGGGSAIDTAKAVALLLKYPPQADPYQVFWGERQPSSALQSELDIPLFTVPTTAGTGAEVTPFAVLTRSDINTKRSMYHNAYPTAAFLDPRYIEDSPDFLLHAGIFDALAHGIESYLHRDSTPLGKMFAEYGFSLFGSFKDKLKDGGFVEADYDSMLLAAFIQGLACMQSSTTLPHGLGYPLAHRRVPHGLACGIFLGEYMKSVKEKSAVEHIAGLCGFSSVDELADLCGEIMRADIKLEVSEDDILQWTDNFMQTQTIRLETNPEPVGRDDIERLYRASLKDFMK